jgi:hypothetical protein
MKTSVQLFKLGILAVFILTLAACGVQTKPASNLPSNLGQAVVTLPDHKKPLKVTYEIVDGYAMFEGDINLGKVDENGKLLEADIASQGVGIEGRNFRWPNGVVPFVITGNWGATNAAMQANITSAVNHWNSNTNFRFVARTTEPAFVNFVAGTG